MLTKEETGKIIIKMNQIQGKKMKAVKANEGNPFGSQKLSYFEGQQDALREVLRLYGRK